ncbi:MAG: hypothetical protein ABIJ39_13865 [Chloroflexota bacterium]
MKPILYESLQDEGLESQVADRYRAEVDALARLGFRRLGLYGETLIPAGVLLLFPVVIAMLLKKEVLAWRGFLRITFAYPLMVHHEEQAYALPLGMGVKFYTRLMDETLVITANFPSEEIANMITKVYKSSSKSGIETAWQGHREHVDSFIQGGKAVDGWVSMEKFMALSSREDAEMI